MKKRTLQKLGMHALSGLIMAMPMIMIPTMQSQSLPENDRSLSPYFMIPDGDPSTDRIPLLSTSAEVNIAGVIADVKITQVYKNEGENPIEAIYVFPASTRAAVYSMQMTIGERKIVATIKEREEARQDYEDARANGQTASLLEQERPNVFSMNVANIMPGDEILVEMSYTELLVPEGGVYAFVYPAVVGPRYSNASGDLASAGDDWIKNPYTPEGEAPLYDFDIRTRISAGMPVQEVSCSSHNMDISFEDPSVALLKLKEGEAASGNRDVIIHYRLSGGKIESGLLLFEGEQENFFLAMIQPPARPEVKHIPPREYVFILDISGSMYGFPLDVSKKLMRDLLGKLRPSDRFNILLFAGGSSLFSEHSKPATSENIRRGIDFIDRQNGGGGTELLPALKRALALEGTEDFARSFVILTDGYVSVEKEAFDLIRNKLDEASFFPFGIGSSVNHYLIEGMAKAGKGSPFVVTSEDQASATAEKFRKYIQQPVLTNIEVSFPGFRTYEVEPSAMADVFAERPLIIFGKYRGTASGKISIKGLSGEGEYMSSLDAGEYIASTDNSALKYLWAREKISRLDDYASLDMNTGENQELITSLGLKYNLLTRYTSFVAIDNTVRNEDGNFTTVNQPLPLPEGVSNYAVGGVSGRRYSNASMPTSCCEKSVLRMSLDDVEEEEPLFTTVEKMPEFTGHEKGIAAFFEEHLAYPAEAKKKGIEGVVYVSFVVEKDGSLSGISILRSPDPLLEAEAIRLIEQTEGLWAPGEQRGRKIRCSMHLPVHFSLGE